VSLHAPDKIDGMLIQRGAGETLLFPVIEAGSVDRDDISHRTAGCFRARIEDFDA
jgi:hypothetical protein